MSVHGTQRSRLMTRTTPLCSKSPAPLRRRSVGRHRAHYRSGPLSRERIPSPAMLLRGGVFVLWPEDASNLWPFDVPARRIAQLVSIRGFTAPPEGPTNARSIVLAGSARTARVRFVLRSRSRRRNQSSDHVNRRDSRFQRSRTSFGLGVGSVGPRFCRRDFRQHRIWFRERGVARHDPIAPPGFASEPKLEAQSSPLNFSFFVSIKTP
jgi:hypothetical protein